MDEIPTAWLWRHRSIGLGFGAGILGFALLYGGWHLWEDHAALHRLMQIETPLNQIIQIEIQRQQAARPPAPAPAPNRGGGG